MDNNRVKIAFFSLLALLFIAICVGCFVWGSKSVDIPEITTEIRWDTVRVEVPVPYKVEKVRKEYVYVPTPADTVVKEVEVVRVDSVLVAVDIERREYKDALYRAVVSGAVVGDIHPTLESMEVYARNETRVVERSVPLLRPYISASVGREMMGIGGGVSIKDRVDVGAKYMRVGGTDAVMFEASYRFKIKGR